MTSEESRADEQARAIAPAALEAAKIDEDVARLARRALPDGTEAAVDLLRAAIWRRKRRENL